jgi:hypothetical protein
MRIILPEAADTDAKPDTYPADIFSPQDELALWVNANHLDA